MGGVLIKNVQAADSTVLQATEHNLDPDDDDILNLKAPARVKNIHIDGLKVSKNELVTNQLDRLFNVKTFDTLLTEAHLCKLKLERLGVFSGIEVFVDIAKDSTGNEFDVYYFVKENRRLSANVGTNVGQNEGSMTLGGKLNNLRGSGESIRINSSFGTQLSSSYELAFSKPVQYDPDRKLTVRALGAITDYLQSQYKEDAKGVAFDMCLPSGLGLHTVSLDYIWRENLINSNAPFDIREHAGHSLKSSLKHTLVSDGRDDWILPSKGHLLKHNIEYLGVAGNVKGIKTDLEIQLNKEIFPDIVLAGSINTGYAKSLSNDPLLINDRYFVGGPLSVRGFAFKGIGRHAQQASLGGEIFCASGLHLYTPLPFRPGHGGFGDLFRLHFFANAGNLTNVSGFDKQDFLKKTRYSYGLGIMFMLGGMARLEVNYCIPKNAQVGDIINEGWQIGVGLNFL